MRAFFATNLKPTSESPFIRMLLIFLTLFFITIFLLLPVITIFFEALREGFVRYFKEITHPESIAAIKLTVMVAAIAVPLNMVFGVICSWCVAKFDFFGRSFLLTLVDLPFSVSPVISGLIYALIFGAHNSFGRWFIERDIEILFALPGLVLATVFVTFPFVARELIPLMEEQGSDEEEAAILLGASPFKVFFKITLPKIKWGLFYGVLLCNARAMGEFGAVSIVSGHIRGLTNTIPLHVEILYNEYNFVAAFAVASVLTILAFLTLIAKSILEWKLEKK